MLTFKSLKSIESNQPPSMNSNTPRLDTFNQSKIEIVD